MFRGLLLLPFIAGLGLIVWIIGILLFIFWVWMIVDCVKRKFKNNNEKLVWLLVIVLSIWMGTIGAWVYYFAVKIFNPKGIIGK